VPARVAELLQRARRDRGVALGDAQIGGDLVERHRLGAQQQVAVHAPDIARPAPRHHQRGEFIHEAAFAVIVGQF